MMMATIVVRMNAMAMLAVRNVDADRYRQKRAASTMAANRAAAGKQTGEITAGEWLAARVRKTVAECVSL